MDIAQDCLHFVTKFFEPISVSSTHIYHSALELCPTSSIVRKLYYDRYNRISRFPRVVSGTPDTWDPNISFSSKDDYDFCTWSQCGQFIAAKTGEHIEVRNQLTFELLSLLRFPEDTFPRSDSQLAYSPDGRSLACSAENTIVIWDIQTGGVAKEIVTPPHSRIVSLVWSSDGRTIASISTIGHPLVSKSGVDTYEITSGARLFTELFDHGVSCYLWACKKSFRLMTAMLSETTPPEITSSEITSSKGNTTLNITISKIGSTLIKIESHSVMIRMELDPRSSWTATFSPSTYRASIEGLRRFSITDIRNSDCLLEEHGSFYFSQFSSNGNLFAASYFDDIHIWKYTSGKYTLWGKFRLPYSSAARRHNPLLQISPSSSSILVLDRNLLLVRRLNDPPTTPQSCRQLAAISRSCTYIAATRHSEWTVKITGLHSQAPSQFIDTGVEVCELVIIDNVLIVVSGGKVVAWLLTDEGTVNGMVDKGRAGQGDSILTLSCEWGRSCLLWKLRVEGHFGVISDGFRQFIYHTETGHLLDKVDQLQRSSCPWIYFWRYFSDPGSTQCLRYHSLARHDTPPKTDWLFPPNNDPSHQSNVTLGVPRQVGWVMDPEGRHRLWVPFEWRESWKRENWYHDITTLFSRIVDQTVIIKF